MPNAIVKGEVSKATPSFVFPSGKVIVMGFFLVSFERGQRSCAALTFRATAPQATAVRLEVRPLSMTRLLQAGTALDPTHSRCRPVRREGGLRLRRERAADVDALRLLDLAIRGFCHQLAQVREPRTQPAPRIRNLRPSTPRGRQASSCLRQQSCFRPRPGGRRRRTWKLLELDARLLDLRGGRHLVVSGLLCALASLSRPRALSARFRCVGSAAATGHPHASIGPSSVHKVLVELVN